MLVRQKDVLHELGGSGHAQAATDPSRAVSAPGGPDVLFLWSVRLMATGFLWFLPFTLYFFLNSPLPRPVQLTGYQRAGLGTAVDE